MAETLKLMAVLAHPDDESLGVGGILAKYAAEGIETSLVTATRGERGWFGDEHEYPGLEALGQIREAELRAAAEVLGIRSVDFLEYIDGERSGRQCAVTGHNYPRTISLNVCQKSSTKLFGVVKHIIAPSAWSMVSGRLKAICSRG